MLTIGVKDREVRAIHLYMLNITVCQKLFVQVFGL
jgi:hypothetical protein